MSKGTCSNAHEEERQRLKQMSCVVGNTPLLAIDYSSGGKAGTIFAKLECFNLSGSIKDRMALHILCRAFERGDLKPGAPIIEVTSGNTGIAFAAIGTALGHPVTIFMPHWMSQERKDLISGYGAKLVIVGPGEGDFLGGVQMAEALAAKTPGVFLPCQFTNEDNWGAHFTSTGPEIVQQLASISQRPDAFVAGVGTGGTIMGVGYYLREEGFDIGLYPTECTAAPALACGIEGGEHRILGISDGFVPEIVDTTQFTEVIGIEDGDAILMAQKLATRLGLGVGISSGANLLGAIKVQEKLGVTSVVATVFADDNKKYLSTDLMRPEPVRDDYLTPQVDLLRYRVLRPVSLVAA